MQTPAQVDDDDLDERKRGRLTIALLAFVAVVQLAGMLAQGVRDLTGIAMHSIVVLPAAGFAIGLSRGLRLRIGMIAFALLWSGLSIWAAVELTRFAETIAVTVPGIPVKAVSPWFVRVVAARSVCFTAAVFVLVMGRAGRRRLRAGAVLGALFAVLFIVEHGYQLLH